MYLATQHTMSAPDPVPNRSSRGCLTCKQRKKKCDEQKPKCQRCMMGGFECQGYAPPEGTGPLTQKRRGNNSLPLLRSGDQAPTVASGGLFSHPVSVDHSGVYQNEPYSSSSITPSHEPEIISRNPQLDPFDLDNMKSLIMAEYARLARRVSFRPFPYPVELVLVKYLVRGSNLMCEVLYLGARISRALFEDTNWQEYTCWIEKFQSQILGTHSSLVIVDDRQLADRLAAYCRLTVFAFMISNSSVGYRIFRKGAPIFLQLSARFPDLWKDSYTISLSHTLHSRGYELAKFVVLDTIASLAFGIPPLIRYDTTIHPIDHKPNQFQFLEPVYACPVIVLMALARVNESRVSRLLDWDSSTTEGVEEYEAAVRNWKPGVDFTDQPSQLIVRLAVQESWRQAALIYLYMGICGLNSSDSRVEPLVQQVAQLASTIEAGSSFEPHLFVPCLIAGVAARKERHRFILRKKIQVSQGIDACLLRGADFTFVLDHLWHGAASGGNPVTWDDYIHSRDLVLPVPVDV